MISLRYHEKGVNMNDQKNRRFYLIADFILFLVIIILLLLVKNPGISFRKPLTSLFNKTGKVIVTQLSRIHLRGIRKAPGSGQSLDSEVRLPDYYVEQIWKASLDTRKSVSVNPVIHLFKNRFLVANSPDGPAFTFDLKHRSLSAGVQSLFSRASALKPYQENYIFQDIKNQFYIFNPSKNTVTPLFHYATGNSLTDSPGLCDLNRDRVPELIMANSVMHIICLDGKNFSPLWTYSDATADIYKSPVCLKIDSDSYPDPVFASKDGRIYALSGRSGWVLWTEALQKKLISQIHTADINGNGKKEILIKSEEGDLICLASSGSKLWQISFEGAISEKIIFPDLNKDGARDPVVISESSSLTAIDGISRMSFWVHNQTSPLIPATLTSLRVNKDRYPDVLFADRSGHLTILNGRTGRIITSYELEALPYTGFISKGRSLYYLDESGRVFCLAIRRK